MIKQRIIKKQPPVLDAMLFDGTVESAQSIVEWVQDCNESAAYLERQGIVRIIQDGSAFQVRPFEYVVRSRGIYGSFTTIPQQDLVDDYYILEG